MDIGESSFGNGTEKLRKAHEGNKERGRRTKQRIYSLIAKSEPEGMTTYELIEATKDEQRPRGFHRDRIHTVCRELIIEGLVTRRGKFGRYRLGTKGREDMRVRAFLFQRQLFKKFYSLSKPGVSFSCKFSKITDSERYKSLPSLEQLEQYSKEVSNIDKDVDELYLFEYALKLGAILTYQLIQGIRYAQEKVDLDETKRTDLIIKWIEDVMEPGSIMKAFSQLITVSKRMQTPKEPSLFELQEVKFEELENIFKNVFPLLFTDLEKIRVDPLREITTDIKAHKHRISKSERIDQLWKEDPDHIKCGGEAKPKPRGPEAFRKFGVISNSKGDTINIYSGGQDIQPIKKCTGCGRRIVMRWMTPIKCKPFRLFLLANEFF